MPTTRIEAEMREVAESLLQWVGAYTESDVERVADALLNAYRNGLEAAAKVIDKHAESAEAYPLRQVMVARAQEGRMLAECIRALIPQARTETCRTGGEG
jgi:hypothetical protein